MICRTVLSHRKGGFYFCGMQYTDEKVVAEQAERILTAALRNKIGTLGFVHHVSGQSGKRISDAHAVAGVKEGEAREGGTRHYMNRLSLKMPVHGFVQNFGDRGIRAGHTRVRHKPKSTAYQVRTHQWNLPEKDFIAEAVRGSGVAEFVLENIARIRGEELMLYLKYYFESGKMT